jgi:hypothetical protein
MACGLSPSWHLLRQATQLAAQLSHVEQELLLPPPPSLLLAVLAGALMLALVLAEGIRRLLAARTRSVLQRLPLQRLHQRWQLQQLLLGYQGHGTWGPGCVVLVVGGHHRQWAASRCWQRWRMVQQPPARLLQAHQHMQQQQPTAGAAGRWCQHGRSWQLGALRGRQVAPSLPA